jgi:hypothetical protein
MNMAVSTIQVQQHLIRKTYHVALDPNSNVSPFTHYKQVEIPDDITRYGEPISMYAKGSSTNQLLVQGSSAHSDYIFVNGTKAETVNLVLTFKVN